MSLSTLPAVLVQTLMHSLPAKEILALACASRWTMQCADSAFPWRHCPTSWVTAETTDSTVAQLMSSRLRAHIPLSLDWHRYVQESYLPEDVAALETIASRLRVLHLRIVHGMSASLTRSVLSLPCLQQLRRLDLEALGQDPPLQELCQLPLLHTLTLGDILASDDAYLQLRAAPSLTSLSVQGGGRHPWLPSVVQLTSLRHLTVSYPGFFGSSFADFCCAPHMARLESLTLLHWEQEQEQPDYAIPTDDLTRGFAALRSLRQLRLAACCNVVTALPHLRFAPSLRVLVLRSDTECEDQSLLDLMDSAPHLRLELSFSQYCDDGQISGYESIAAHIRLVHGAHRCGVVSAAWSDEFSGRIEPLMADGAPISGNASSFKFKSDMSKSVSEAVCETSPSCR